jgi:phosphohistidine phosphatase SixA
MRCSRVLTGERFYSRDCRGIFFVRAVVARVVFCCSLVVLTLSSAAVSASPATDSWKMLARGGYVVLLRHTSTVPGVGDPPGFSLDDCATQRNLSAEGRAQAMRWRAAIAENKVAIGDVFSSEWCRCVDTAQLAFGGATVQPKKWSALNSFFEAAQNQSAQTAAIKKRLPALLQAAKKSGNNAVLITHQVNISALTGVAPQSGEAVIIELDAQRNIVVAGRLIVE